MKRWFKKPTALLAAFFLPSILFAAFPFSFWKSAPATHTPTVHALVIGGGAGGGGGGTRNGGNGFAGVVIISYPTSYILATATGTYSQTSSGGNYIFTFTGSGTITF